MPVVNKPIKTKNPWRPFVLAGGFTVLFFGWAFGEFLFKQTEYSVRTFSETFLPTAHGATSIALYNGSDTRPYVPTPISVPVIPPNTVYIPSLKITAPIQFPKSRTEKAYQASLLNGVALFPGLAKVGELGNAYIFGHSSDYPWSKGKYKTVFATLPKIKVGAIIYASDAKGAIWKYRVTQAKVISKKDGSALSQGGKKNKWLTLQTSYPVGTAAKRFVAIAVIEGGP